MRPALGRPLVGQRGDAYTVLAGAWYVEVTNTVPLDVIVCAGGVTVCVMVLC